MKDRFYKSFPKDGINWLTQKRHEQMKQETWKSMFFEKLVFV